MHTTWGYQYTLPRQPSILLRKILIARRCVIDWLVDARMSDWMMTVSCHICSDKFSHILFHEKKTPSNAVRAQRQSQFTPKMKANAVPRLLSSLVWIDQYNECKGKTSFMEVMSCDISFPLLWVFLSSVTCSWSIMVLLRCQYTCIQSAMNRKDIQFVRGVPRYLSKRGRGCWK